MTNTWLNKDGLFLQYGTQKAVPEVGGEYKNFGGNRSIEVLIDLTKLTSTAAIQSYTTFFPSPPSGQLYIEQVDVVAETGATSGTTFSVGLIQQDQATIPSNYSTAFVNAMVTASVATAGDKVSLTTGITYAGGLIGTYPAAATGPYYITALSSGTYTTGLIRVRIAFHGLTPITQ